MGAHDVVNVSFRHSEISLTWNFSVSTFLCAVVALGFLSGWVLRNKPTSMFSTRSNPVLPGTSGTYFRDSFLYAVRISSVVASCDTCKRS